MVQLTYTQNLKQLLKNSSTAAVFSYIVKCTMLPVLVSKML